jgi:hypothetical protein
VEGRSTNGKQFILMEQAAYGWFKGQFMLKRKQVNPVSYVHGLIALKKKIIGSKNNVKDLLQR